MSGVMTGGDERLLRGERRAAEPINGANLRPSNSPAMSKDYSQLSPSLLPSKPVVLFRSICFVSHIGNAYGVT